MRHVSRRFIAVLILTAFIINFTSPAFSDDPLTKLGRGAANIVTSPFEIFNQMEKSGSLDGGGMAGWTVGPIKGVFMTGVRAVVGAYEVCTFLIPIPKDYGPILKYPEFFFEDSMA